MGNRTVKEVYSLLLQALITFSIFFANLVNIQLPPYHVHYCVLAQSSTSCNICVAKAPIYFGH